MALLLPTPLSSASFMIVKSRGEERAVKIVDSPSNGGENENKGESFECGIVALKSMPDRCYKNCSFDAGVKI
jgi:hypothetical protein